ncbi:response regulator transcription factor [Bifidobacterium simiiventris]|uniref:response regulator transcription factor n=1 Tax=Bifidobacterium simiiventris TaxID=2834434 RepID=UPI001C58DC1F|nr:response regulator transcription factor [Bifidobacterium simiiventris]MBW3078162.1 response regulator transcription factor [Bifidobacterium simiiventris]
MTTIAIVDNDRFALGMLTQIVGRAMPGANVIWTAEDGRTAVHRCLYEGEAQVPDVLVLDMSLGEPGMGADGADACRMIREASARPAILCLTSYSRAHYRQTAIDAGAQGLIGKDSTPRELAAAVIAVADGQILDGFMDVNAAHAALASVAQRTAALSDQEREVMRLYATNHTTEEIAQRLGIKASTVFVVTRHAKRKLGASSRAEAIRILLGG